MERIDETQFLSAPREALERVRSSGETLEILKDGRTVAHLVPAPPACTILPGGSKSVLALVDPADTLDDLLSADDVAAWYLQSTSPE